MRASRPRCGSSIRPPRPGGKREPGVLRLFVLAERRELKAQVQWLPQIEKIRLYAAPLASSDLAVHRRTLIDLLAARALSMQRTTCRADADEFEAQRLFARKLIVPSVQESDETSPCRSLRPITKCDWPWTSGGRRREIRAWTTSATTRGAVARGLSDRHAVDLAAALPAISAGNFTAAGQAGQRRSPRPREHRPVAPRWRQYEERLAQHQVRGLADPELAHFRWMLEELRVSLFAQELGTSLAVSPQRLDKQWQKVQT